MDQSTLKTNVNLCILLEHKVHDGHEVVLSAPFVSLVSFVLINPTYKER